MPCSNSPNSTAASATADKADWASTKDTPPLAALRNQPFHIQCDAFKELVSGGDDHLPQPQVIYDVLKLICEAWWEGDVIYGENANESGYRLSFIQGFEGLTWHAYHGRLSASTDDPHLVSVRAPIVIVQMAARILLPDPHRSGDGVHIVDTAQDYLSLQVLRSLQVMEMLAAELKAASDLREGILKAALSDPDLDPVSKSMVVTALAAQPQRRTPIEVLERTKSHQQVLKLTKFAQYFSSADYLRDQSTVGIKAAILEASFYTVLLQDARSHSVFPLTESKEQDKYIEYIPVMSTIPSTTFERCAPPQWLFDLMLWSMFIFLVDEYMEAIVAQFSATELADFCVGLELIHPDPDPGLSIITVPQLSAISGNGSTNPWQDGTTFENAGRSERVYAALSVYYSWAGWVLNWGRLAQATVTDMNEFRSEIKKYLLFHVHQIQDNVRFAKQQGRVTTEADVGAPLARFETPRTGFTTWLHTVGAGHISAPVSLAFAAAYMGSGVRGGRDGWSSLMQRILAHEMNQHVGAYCRLYNDYGSVGRDLREGNLNSVNFPEFWTEAKASQEAGNPSDTHNRLKSSLLAVAEHERRMADMIGREFYQSLELEGKEQQGPRIASALRVYFGSAALFSDMYLTRDVTNSVK